MDGATNGAAFANPPLIEGAVKKWKRKSREHNAKDANKPKRPMTAYNYFFQEERRRIMAGEDSKVVMVQSKGKKKKWEAGGDAGHEGGVNEDENPDGGPMKITFEDLGRIIGQRWRNLEGEALNRYKERADRDSQRYQKEMKRYYEEQVSAMCHGYNDPIPSGLFRCGDEGCGGGGGAKAATPADLGGGSTPPPPAKKAAPLDRAEARMKPASPQASQRSGDRGAAGAPAGAGAVPTAALGGWATPASQQQQRPGPVDVGDLPPPAALALLEQLMEQQRRDEEAIAFMMLQQRQHQQRNAPSRPPPASASSQSPRQSPSSGMAPPSMAALNVLLCQHQHQHQHHAAALGMPSGMPSGLPHGLSLPFSVPTRSPGPSQGASGSGGGGVSTMDPVAQAVANALLQQQAGRFQKNL